jgi:hypothetical protein
MQSINDFPTHFIGTRCARDGAIQFIIIFHANTLSHQKNQQCVFSLELHNFSWLVHSYFLYVPTEPRVLPHLLRYLRYRVTVILSGFYNLLCDAGLHVYDYPFPKPHSDIFPALFA